MAAAQQSFIIEQGQSFQSLLTIQNTGSQLPGRQHIPAFNYRQRDQQHTPGSDGGGNVPA